MITIARRVVTKPTQAASARQLDRWQKRVTRAIAALEKADADTVLSELVALLRSMQHAERR